MFFITLTICHIVAGSAKVLHYQNNEDPGNDNRLSVSETTEVYSATPLESWEDPLWVLRLHDPELNFTHLRSATVTEEEYFVDKIAPLLYRNFQQYLEYKQRRASRREKKDDPNRSYSSDLFYDQIQEDHMKDNRYTEGLDEKSMNEVKYKVMQMINKFVLSLQNEPDTSLPEGMDAYEEPTLTIYFKGPFTALLVIYEKMVWQFIIKPPSPLPEWFYDEHPEITLDKYEMYAKIPNAVKELFFVKLLHLLTSLFGFPM